mgnify:FL=1
MDLFLCNLQKVYLDLIQTTVLTPLTAATMTEHINDRMKLLSTKVP